MIVETTEQYMKRKGLKRGARIVASGPQVIVETTEAYMVRKGIPEGGHLVDPNPAPTLAVETQVDYLARKATEAEAEKSKGTRSKK